MATLLMLGDYKVESIVKYNENRNELDYSLYVTHIMSEKRAILHREYIFQNTHHGKTQLKPMLDCLGLEDTLDAAIFLSANHTLIIIFQSLQIHYVRRYDPNFKKLDGQKLGRPETNSMYLSLSNGMEAEILRESKLIQVEN